jgi:hypothetical protein
LKTLRVNQLGTTYRSATSLLESVGRIDREAEHHAALMMLGDGAVRHPASGIRDVEEDVDRLARPDPTSSDCAIRNIATTRSAT